MDVSEFNYELPQELIAQDPLEDRASSRLMVLHRKSGEIEHRTFRDIKEYLRKGDCLVINDTNIDATNFFKRLTVKTSAGDSTVTLTVADAFEGFGVTVPGGYLGYLDIGSALVKPNTEVTVGMWWTTPDGITVYGTGTRTVSFGNGTRTGISCTDDFS